MSMERNCYIIVIPCALVACLMYMYPRASGVYIRQTTCAYGIIIKGNAVIVTVFVTTGASCIGELLKVNISLQELIMEGNPINDDGMSLVVDALLWNTTLTKLNVFMCGFSVKGTT